MIFRYLDSHGRILIGFGWPIAATSADHPGGMVDKTRRVIGSSMRGGEYVLVPLSSLIK